MMGQGIGPVAMVVVAVPIVNQIPDLFAQGSIDHDERVASATAVGLRLLQHEPGTAAIHGVRPPGGL